MNKITIAIVIAAAVLGPFSGWAAKMTKSYTLRVQQEENKTEANLPDLHLPLVTANACYFWEPTGKPVDFPPPPCLRFTQPSIDV